MKKNIRKYSDSAIGDFISKAVDRVSNFAADNPKKTLVITTIAPALAFLIFKIAGQYIDAAREIKKIKSGQFDERQFVESYKKKYGEYVERARMELVRELGPEGRDPKVVHEYLDDVLNDLDKIIRAKTVRDIANATGEIRLKRIADALDAYKSQNNLKDSANLLGAMRLMNARLPGATFCSRRYGDGINMRHYDRKARLDRCYRDNVIAVAKEKTKAALSKAKQLAGKHPRITKALGIMLAALATGSAIAISRAKKQVQPVFEEIGPLAVKQPSMSQPLKEAFGWFSKAESAFDESAKRFSGKKDSAFAKKKKSISTEYSIVQNKKSNH